MGYYDITIVKSKAGVPLTAIIDKEVCVFENTDVPNEYYTESKKKHIGVFVFPDGNVQVEKVDRAYSDSYKPYKTLKIITQSDK